MISGGGAGISVDDEPVAEAGAVVGELGPGVALVDVVVGAGGAGLERDARAKGLRGERNGGEALDERGVGVAGAAVVADGLGDRLELAEGGEGALSDVVALRGLERDVEDEADGLGGAALVEDDDALGGAEDDALRRFAAPAGEADALLGLADLLELGEEAVDQGLDVGGLAEEVRLGNVVREELRGGAGPPLVVGHGGVALGEEVEAVDSLHHQMA